MLLVKLLTKLIAIFKIRFYYYG